jgi:hypothetical protein
MPDGQRQFVNVGLDRLGRGFLPGGDERLQTVGSCATSNARLVLQSFRC